MLHSNDTLTVNGGKLIEVTAVLTGVESNGISRDFHNVFHFYRDDSFTFNPADIINSFASSVFAAILNLTNSSVSATLGLCRDLSNPASAAVEAVFATAGDGLGDRLPATAGIVFNLKTGLRGRNYRGSKHLVGGSESITTKDELNGAGIAAAANFLSIFNSTPAFTDGSGNAWKSCVLSHTLSQLSTAPCVVTYADVTSCTLNLTL